MNTPEKCPKCGAGSFDKWTTGHQFECNTLVLSNGLTFDGLICMKAQRDHLAERVKRLEEESAEYQTLFCNWKAYATNLESVGQRMFDGGYHAPHIAAEWREAKETRP